MKNISNSTKPFIAQPLSYDITPSYDSYGTSN